jgi:hypothetical protein
MADHTPSKNVYLYRVRNRSNLYYSPKAMFRRWNGVGKFLTRQALGQVKSHLDAAGIEYMVETWDALYLFDSRGDE